jgi:hypothetical protein
MEIRTFAFVVNGEVIGTIMVPDTADSHQRLWAGLSSNPIVVESTATEGVQYGWTYDGTNFIAPGA